jgi:DNA (cytosine-5)-methyltransferase 1
MEGFDCIATNELVERRLAIQIANKKCKYESGYVKGDVSNPEVKNRLFDEIKKWELLEHLKEVDLVVATPPCQGMSVANHKRSANEIARNSLIVESIKIVSQIKPRVFVFENVPRFLTTICTDTDGIERPIGEAIERNLGLEYSIYSRVINFKEFGASSSRSRTLVIGVRVDLANFVSPIELFPDYKNEVTLKQAIGSMPRLKRMGEIDPTDIFHSFRSYPRHMESWISGLKPGQTAFENSDVGRIPHQVIDGKIVVNQEKNGDKYRRQIWEKVGPCVHTRNDQLASQNTVHPEDNRVFSIRELMKMMTVPASFKWTSDNLKSLNLLTKEEKISFLKRNEMNIRQSLGEAVPTEIFRSIARNFNEVFSRSHFSDSDVRLEIQKENLTVPETMVRYLRENPKNLGYSSLSRVVELANAKRHEQEAFFTDKRLVTEIVKYLPKISSETISILEPSVGAGNFLPLVFLAFQGKRINLTVCDVDKDALTLLRELMHHVKKPKGLRITYRMGDFLQLKDETSFDLVIGNPPFSKSASKDDLKAYRSTSGNIKAQNTAAFFIEKAIDLAKHVALVMPKSFLNTPEFEHTRNKAGKSRIDAIIDFGEQGFGGVLVETIAISLTTGAKAGKTTVTSMTEMRTEIKAQSYITDTAFPYWLIYRDSYFDLICSRLKFDVFDVFRDRQVTTKIVDTAGEIRVIKSRNIPDTGSRILNVENYDSYISKDEASKLAVYKFLDNEKVYLTPNMTYKPRVIRKPKGTIVNGSAAVLILKDGELPLSKSQLDYFSTDEYRRFYRIARNRQTRSLNVDSSSVFFFGKLVS